MGEQGNGFKGTIGLDIRDSNPEVSKEDKAKFDFSRGRVIKVTYQIAKDAHVNIERAMAAKMARD